MRFKDRVDAGTQLAAQLMMFADRGDVVVLGLPRGGVPVAAQVAKAIHAPLDVLLSRKLGVPGQEELAFGAVSTSGGRYLDERIIRAASLTPEQIDGVTRQVRTLLQQREQLYRGKRTPASVRHQIVILVDDGIATGASITAAIHALRSLKPKKIVVAAPVAPAETCQALRGEADAVIVLQTPAHFSAVGQFYEDFRQVSDDEVVALLQPASRAITRPLAYPSTPAFAFQQTLAGEK